VKRAASADDGGMKKPYQLSVGLDNPSPRRRPALSSRPRKYVEVHDLRSMLKLGLGLHLPGDPAKRLTRALNGLGRLAGADSWVAASIAARPRQRTKVSAILAGGEDALAARTRLEADCLRPESPIRKLLESPEQIPGRVLAMTSTDDRGNNNAIAICSILCPDTSGAGRVTWVSIHRRAGQPPLGERERRLVELFHSQSAWLLLKM
jgi:hypothetical protein